MKAYVRQLEPWWQAIQRALKPKLLLTMSISFLGAVMILGLLFVPAGHESLADIFMSFTGLLGALLWFLFGLTAVAHQLHQDMRLEAVPNTVEALRFSWGKARSLVLLPAWGVTLLSGLLVAELLLLALANIPGLGLIWLSLLAVPLLLFNSVVAVALILALFNIAARVVLVEGDAEQLKSELWQLMKQRLPTLLLYNLGGVLISCVVAIVVLSPLWLGAQVTWSLMDYTAAEALTRMVNGIGFWGSIAHLVALLMLGALVAAVAGIPCIAITHMTLLVHQELMADEVVEPNQEAKAASE